MATPPFLQQQDYPDLLSFLLGKQPQPIPDAMDASQIPQGRPSPQMVAQVAPPQPQAQQPQGETKGHKLLKILMGAAQGGLNGMAANSQTYAATGRNAGFGGGFLGSQQIPIQQQMAKNQLAQQQAQTELLKAQSQMVQTPFGAMPMGMAKVMFPSLIKGQAETESAKIRAGATTEAAQTHAQASRDVANINQGTAIPMDPDTARMIGMPELANVPVGRGTWTNANKALEAQGLRVQDMGKNGTDENSGMWLMNKTGNRIRQVSPNSLTFQRGASFAQNRPEVVVDQNDPGYAYFTSAAEAMNKHLPSPQGAATQGAKTEARSEVPTKVGDQKVAFNTAMQHADLLQQAAKALQNGDVQALNNLKNKFATQFGSPGPVNAQAIADAYTREVTKMLSAGHLTDSEIGTVGATLNPNKQSMAQINGVLGSYKALAQSKLNMLNQQIGSIRNPKAAAASTSGFSVKAPNGKTYNFDSQQKLDAFKKEAGLK